MDIPQIPNLIHLAIPGFVLLILLEVLFVALQKHHDRYVFQDTATSLSMGIGNVITGLFTKTIVLGAYFLAWEYRFFDLGWGAWVWVIAFFCEDFTYYWFHRSSHGVRLFWASHVVHHSSQKYNLGTALRQTWTGLFSGVFVFWLWMPLFGFHPLLVATLQSCSLIYQFWIHTETIAKLWKPIEWFFNTPSHHRVHHGNDVEYLDKNHAGVLIIWDRLFGTFQEEKHRPTYGLTNNLDTFNPLRVATHEWAAIFRDLAQSSTWRQALGYLFGPPGWSHDGSRKTTAQLRRDS